MTTYEGAITRTGTYGSAFTGVLDLRRKAIQEVQGRLLLLPGVDQPELSPLLARLSVLGQRVSSLLWSLRDCLEAFERGHASIQRRLGALADHAAELSAQAVGDERAGMRIEKVDQLRASLERELRDDERRWQETRAEFEKELSEHLAAYDEVLSQVEAATNQQVDHPGLSQVLCFLHEPAPREVFIIDPPLEAPATGRRLA